MQEWYGDDVSETILRESLHFIATGATQESPVGIPWATASATTSFLFAPSSSPQHQEFWDLLVDPALRDSLFASSPDADHDRSVELPLPQQELDAEKSLTLSLVVLEHVVRRVCLWLKSHHRVDTQGAQRPPPPRISMLLSDLIGELYTDVVVRADSFLLTLLADAASDPTQVAALATLIRRLRVLLLPPPVGLHLRNLVLHGYLVTARRLSPPTEQHDNRYSEMQHTVAAQFARQGASSASSKTVAGSEQATEVVGPMCTSHVFLASMHLPHSSLLECVSKAVRMLLWDSITLFGQCLVVEKTQKHTQLIHTALPLPGLQDEPVRRRALQHADVILSTLAAAVPLVTTGDTQATRLPQKISWLWTVLEQRLRWQHATLLASKNCADQSNVACTIAPPHHHHSLSKEERMIDWNSYFPDDGSHFVPFAELVTSILEHLTACDLSSVEKTEDTKNHVVPPQRIRLLLLMLHGLCAAEHGPKLRDVLLHGKVLFAPRDVKAANNSLQNSAEWSGSTVGDTSLSFDAQRGLVSLLLYAVQVFSENGIGFDTAIESSTNTNTAELEALCEKFLSDHLAAFSPIACVERFWRHGLQRQSNSSSSPDIAQTTRRLGANNTRSTTSEVDGTKVMTDDVRGNDEDEEEMMREASKPSSLVVVQWGPSQPAKVIALPSLQQEDDKDDRTFPLFNVPQSLLSSGLFLVEPESVVSTWAKSLKLPFAPHLAPFPVVLQDEERSFSPFVIERWMTGLRSSLPISSSSSSQTLPVRISVHLLRIQKKEYACLQQKQAARVSVPGDGGEGVLLDANLSVCEWVLRMFSRLGEFHDGWQAKQLDLQRRVDQRTARSQHRDQLETMSVVAPLLAELIGCVGEQLLLSATVRCEPQNSSSSSRLEEARATNGTAWMKQWELALDRVLTGTDMVSAWHVPLSALCVFHDVLDKQLHKRLALL